MIISLLIAITSSSFAFASPNKLSGHILIMSEHQMTFVTSDTEYEIDLDHFKARSKKVLRQHFKAKLDLDIYPDENAILKKRPALGVLPDCREKPFSFDDLVEITKASTTKDKIDFLKAIPKDAMQTFTLVYESKSSQRDDVSPLWPRVIRTTADGKLIIAYTCKPGGSNYNSIEVIRFDDTTAHFDFTRLRFKDSATRIEKNSALCMQCHSPSGLQKPDPRPNWEEYAKWPGVYGSKDDNLGDRSTKDEAENFDKFRELQKDNPCYSTLPWATQKPEGYEKYPYRTVPQGIWMPVRPNFRIMLAQAGNLVKQLARKFLENHQYNKVKYLVLMDALGCQSDIDRELHAALPKYETPDFAFFAKLIGADSDYRNIQRFQSAGARLYAIGRALGFSDGEWTLNFDKPNDPNYFLGSEIRIPNYVWGQLLLALGEEHPDAKPLLQFRGFFGRNTYDDIGTEHSCWEQNLIHERLSGSQRKGLCAKLRQYQINSKAGNGLLNKMIQNPNDP